MHIFSRSMRPFMFENLTTTLRWTGILLLFSLGLFLSSCSDKKSMTTHQPMMDDEMMMMDDKMMDKDLGMIAPQIINMAEEQNIIESGENPTKTIVRIQHVEPYMTENLAGKMAHVSAYAAQDGTSLIEVFDIDNSVPMITIYFKLDDMAEQYVKYQTFLAGIVSMGGKIGMEESRAQVADVMKRLEFVAKNSKSGPHIAAGSFTLYFASGPSSYYRVYLRPSDNDMKYRAGDMMPEGMMEGDMMPEGMMEDDMMPEGMMQGDMMEDGTFNDDLPPLQ